MTQNYMDVLRRFFPGSAHIDDLDPNDPDAYEAKSLEVMFTTIVAALTKHGNRKIAILGQHLWEVINQRLVHVARDARPPTLSFLVATTGGVVQGIILVPVGWLAMIQVDPAMEVGAIVYVGSQAVDFFNGRLKFDSSDRIRARAAAYEAEFLKTLPRSTLNAYQQEILGKFSNGFDEQFSYAYRSVAASRT
jgi:hypothetical protein